MSVACSVEELAAADWVVVLTPHSQFLDDPIWERAEPVVDTRNVVPLDERVWRI